MIHRLLIFLVIALLISCGSREVTSVKVFKYNQTDHITSLDPAFAKSQNNIWATDHIFDGLVQLDDGLNIVPSIAKSWDISDDGLVYTFYLRDDVYFHKDASFSLPDSTRKVTAVDVKYSLSRLIDESVNSPGSWLFTDKVSGKEAFQAVDDTTFVMTLKTPFIPMMGILTMQYCSVVPRESVEYYKSTWAQQPVGTGPFRFKKWVENQALYLTKNKDYYGESTSNLDGIKTSFIPDKKISYLEVLNNNIDMVSGLESSFAPSLLTREGELKDEYKDQLKFVKSPFLNLEYFGINLTNADADSPLRKKYFRQALNYGIDRNLMLESLRNGVGKAADAGSIPIGLPAYDPSIVKGYYYDKKRAQELIKKAGYSDVSDVPTIDVYTNNTYLDLTTFIAKQWEELGLKISIEVMESGLLRQGMRNQELPLFRASWIADYPDGESYLCMYYSGYPAPPNYTGYKNPEFDKLYELAIKTGDPAKRKKLYNEMDKMIVEDAPLIFLFYDETAMFATSRVDGLSANGINLLKVDSLSVK